jgi:integrase
MERRRTERKRTLTVAAVERIKAPKEGQVDFTDRGYPGLALRVSYGGAKSFVILYNISGRQRRLTLGQYPAMTLLDARDAWRVARQSVARGVDPKARSAASAAMGFPEVVAEWLKRDQSDNRASSRRQVAGVVKADLLPAWGGRRVDEIGKRDVLNLLDAIADRGAPSMARRVYAHLNRFFRWCVERDIITASPMMAMARPGSGTSRERVLTDDELVAVWRGAEELGPFGAVTRLLMLTGSRLNEIAQMEWRELSDDAISLPGDRTKNGLPHIVTLSAPAKLLIAELPHIADCDFVFSTDGRKSITSWSRAKDKLDEASEVSGWRLHDIRRSVATGMAEIGIPPHIIEACLNHVSGHKAGVAGVYNKAAYATEKASALQAWGRYVSMLLNEPVRQAINTELEADGDRDAQLKARLAFNRAITEGDGSWNAYVDSIVNPASNIVALGGRP